ncbi:MAG: hypothetical protein MUF02_05595 [Acidobacteria bacterium]|jgi:hypothetical protein|nr:hypothetical protein [Acidobacteriota bacterium]
MNHKKLSLTLILVLLILLPALPGLAGSDGNGFLIGFFVPYNTFGSDFDGVHFFNAGDEILLVPKMEGGVGYGLALGGRRDSVEWELFYMHSSHDFSFEVIRDKATFDAAGFNGRFYLGRRGVIRPYGSFGMDLCWVKAQNASLTLYEPIRSGAVKFSGLGIVGGVGVGIRPIKAVTLYVGGELRLGLFGRGKGVQNESQKLDSLTSWSFCLRSGLVFVI